MGDTIMFLPNPHFRYNCRYENDKEIKCIVKQYLKNLLI